MKYGLKALFKNMNLMALISMIVTTLLTLALYAKFAYMVITPEERQEGKMPSDIGKLWAALLFFGEAAGQLVIAPKLDFGEAIAAIIGDVLLNIIVFAVGYFLLGIFKKEQTKFQRSKYAFICIVGFNWLLVLTVL